MSCGVYGGFILKMHFRGVHLFGVVNVIFICPVFQDHHVKLK